MGDAHTVEALAGTRGCFDPITLGLHAPSDLLHLGRYSDDRSARLAGTFVHELTHYLQFFGTAFGYAYLVSMRGIVTALNTGMASRAVDLALRFPASGWPIDIHSAFPSAEDRELYTQAILLDRFFNEELYGFTYAHFGNNRPVGEPDGLVGTSPLYLDQADGRTLLVTGETLLENQATTCELAFHGAHTKRERAVRAIEATYLALPQLLQSKYCGYSVWLATLGVHHLEPLLYFILLNQTQTTFLRRLGDYTLVRNAKKLLTETFAYRDVPRPSTAGELRSALERICKCTELDNPLKVLAYHAELAESGATTEGPQWPVDWIAHKIFRWILSDPMAAVYWPLQPHRVLSELPILNIHLGTSPGHDRLHLFNCNDLTESGRDRLLAALSHYTSDVHVVRGLYSRSRVRCPLWSRIKPSVCGSCQACSGFIPDPNIREDCPVWQRHRQLGLARQPAEVEPK